MASREPNIALSRQQRRARERAARNASMKRGALAVGALLAAGSASAATFTVTNVNDSGPGSLRDAVSQANGAAGADTINFQAGLFGTILLTTGEIAITDSVTINGPGAGVISVNGNNSSAVFDVENTGSTTPTTVNINNLTLTGGNNPSGGALRDAGESLTLDHVIVSNSNASDGGGVFFNGTDAATLTVTSSTITGNTANTGGGLALSGSGGITITGSTISGNTASAGGGIADLYATGALSIANTQIVNNTATDYYGGGLFLYRVQAHVTLTSDTISGNKAGQTGGGIDAHVYAGYQLDIANTLISGNTSGTVTSSHGYGGGIFIDSVGESATAAAVNITDSVITGNVADPADAATTTGADAYDLGAGGGIYVNYASLTVRRSTISNNTAYAGGGILQYYGDVTLENVTVAQNHAQSTIAPANAFGGGMYLYYGTASIAESTITNNSAAAGAGGITVYGDTLALTNTIIANNTGAATTPDIDTRGGASVTPNYTLIKTPGAATLNPGTGNLTGVDPNLGALAVNSSTIVAGAPGTTQTPLTEMPQCPSPVINAGDPAFTPPPSTDERGKPRVASGRIDMGAVEVQPSTIGVTVTSQSVNENGNTVAVFVSRTGSADGPVSVSYATANGTAVAPGDYTAKSGTLSWADGDTANKFAVITIEEDTLYEGNETFTVNLSAPTCNAALGAPTDTVTIVDNEAQPSITIGDRSLPEGNSGTTPFTFTLTLSGASAFTTTVNYATADGTATAPSDYAAASGIVTFNPQETSKQITVNVVGDTALEPNETFTVNLSGATNATIAKATATATILNDDAGTADLAITKTAAGGAFFAGQPITYNINVTNNGPNAANAVVVTDPIPPGTTFVSATASQGSCSLGPIVTCSLGALANGGTASIALKVSPLAVGPLSNTATVSAAPQPDPNAANDSATATVTVQPATAAPALGDWAKILVALAIALLGWFKTRE